MQDAEYHRLEDVPFQPSMTHASLDELRRHVEGTRRLAEKQMDILTTLQAQILRLEVLIREQDDNCRRRFQTTTTTDLKRADTTT